MILGILASAGGGASTAYESIATATGTGSSGTITFSSIPSTYTHLQIRGMAYDGSANNIWLRINSDTGTNYARHTLYGTGAAVSADGLATQAQIDTRLYGGYTTNILSAWIIDILDYASTSKNKTVRGFAGYDQNGAGNIDVFSGLWQSTSALTSISIIDNGGNFNTQTTFALYGIKAA
jgi:phosphoserine aminotransferase